MGQKDRVVLDIGTAQIEQPGDIVDGGDEMVAGSGQLELRAHQGQLVSARNGGLRRQMLVDGCAWQTGTVGPGGLDQIDVAAQIDASALHGCTKHLCQGQTQHLAVHRQRFTRLQLPGDPFDEMGSGAGRDFHQRDAGAVQLFFGL